MNILDVALAGRIAASGGGGGSGTDNYNDLSNLPQINGETLAGNKSSSNLGLQDEIDSDHKLSSDLVDDANHTNKFVTSTEKQTWSAKQNAIDADHKLSSDLVDDANKTNKFVTSTEKQTWNNKQNAIDLDHKLSSSLVSFTTAEAAALASGIDSAKVGQISTNQTNILYAIHKVGKNDFNFPVFAKECEVSNGTKVITDESIKLTATSADCFTIPEYNTNNKQYPKEALIPVNSGEKIVFSWVYTPHNSQTNDRVGIFGNGTYDQGKYLTAPAGDGSLEYTVPSDVTYVTVRVGVATSGNSATYSEMMVSKKTAYDANPTYQPFARPNYDLTRLEAEDRAALAEEIDAGAKNLLSLPPISSWRYDGSIFTVSESNGEVTVSKVASSSTKAIEIDLTRVVKTNTYLILSGCPSGGGDNSYQLDVWDNGTFLASDTGSGSVPIKFNTTTQKLRIRFAAQAAVSNIKFKPMLCTKAAFGVSNKFVPYTKSNSQLTTELGSVKTVLEAIL